MICNDCGRNASMDTYANCEFEVLSASRCHARPCYALLCFECSSHHKKMTSDGSVYCWAHFCEVASARSRTAGVLIEENRRLKDLIARLASELAQVDRESK